MARVPGRRVLIGQRAGYYGLPPRDGSRARGAQLPLDAGHREEHKKEERKPVHTSSLAGYALFPCRDSKTCLVVPSAASPPLLDLPLLGQLFTCAN